MFKRKVFYIGGFDPRGARFYHGLLAQQIAAHNARDCAGNSLILSARHAAGHGDTAWTVADATTTITSAFHVLAWDDIVRRAWIRGGLRVLLASARAYVRLLWQTDLACLRRVPHGSRVALFLPALALLVLPLLAGLGAALFAMLIGQAWLAPLFGLALAAVLALMLGGRGHIGWLVQFIIFNDALAAGRGDPALATRLDRFADTIDGALAADPPWDEVLLVSHSNGAVLAAGVIARLLARHGGVLPSRVALVTLGASLPMLASRRDARDFAGTMAKLAQGRFAWLDIGSPTDGAATPLVDPWLGRAPARHAGLVQLSPRWFAFCDAQTYAARRKDKYLTHFDYLRRLDRPSPLDYLGLTCSDQPLAASIAAFRQVSRA
ncbi:hypothetical protein IP65_07425 [Novosphingobium sp. AAP1]|uniref:hypothetical protein n=1 Tax=Novosphingobium sp. AAP1 TaxID=1523413 RepID=UPI0006B9BE99|nr:hypothetical protein [Novosphingobium sp. AAP1]KPF55823.1 hypothetical protein IP65_07425 [Novosphingobium sp. AAP1]